MRLAGIALTGVGLLIAAGCPEKDDPPPRPVAPVAAPPPRPTAPVASVAVPAPSASADTSAVASYPDQVPMGHATIELLQPFTVHQAADHTSPEIAQVGRGTLINVKATHSSWMLIEYPSGVGQLSPGWVDLANVFDRRVRLHKGPLPALPARLPTGLSSGNRPPPPPPRR